MCMTVMQVLQSTLARLNHTNGMDMLTRLMYGGRVSLVIGFIVVFIEAFPGYPAGRYRRILRKMGG